MLGSASRSFPTSGVVDGGDRNVHGILLLLGRVEPTILRGAVVKVAVVVAR
jgi:hypothetical protein